jgi:lipoprotein-anchoring transpeptidase ErfK/SrfK
MTSLSRVAGAAFALALTLCGAACVSQPANTANTTTTNTSTATTTATPETVKTNATDEAAFPVTLPVLDAFFHDETFASDLKTRLQLTDEQIEKLRKTARDETGKLRETDTDDYGGTTAVARTRAAEQIKSIIGDEKARQLTMLVSEKWSGGNDAGGNSDTSAANNGAPNNSGSNAAHATKNQPNAVPTDTRIVVNAPAYRMDVFEGGRLVKSYKVGIGYPEFPLPTGQRKANNIIFNPTWTPPDEPWVESSNKVKPGEKIEAGSKLNPLGPIKIPIGLPSLIHGGKSVARLGSFASHGCVGLTTPQVQDFARTLAQLSGTDLTEEQIATYAKNPKETKEVKLARAVPVELRYETIVVEDGKLHIYRDVYDRDTNTEENLRAVLSTYGVTLEQLSETERASVLNALKEMSRDATGKLDTPKIDEPKPSESSNTRQGTDKSAKNNQKETSANGKKEANANGNQVTRSVKGKKEIVVEIAALKGKGYPAPVDLNTGGASKKQAATTSKPTADKRR